MESTTVDQHPLLTFKSSTYVQFILLLNRYIFPGIPASYPLHKKLNLLKNNSDFGYWWDAFLVSTALIACGLYVCETYTDFIQAAVHVYFITDSIITAIFTVDFIFAFYAAYSTLRFFTDVWTWIDAMTILPFYVELGHATLNINFGSLRFLRIFRLLRVLRIFRLLKSVQGVKKQMAIVCITFTCFVFVGAGIEQVMENDVKQIMQYACNYIGPNTNYLPSCSPNMVATSDCDCGQHGCQLYFNRYDPDGQPSGVKCVSLNFFDSFYFLIVTVGTLGYGDIFPTTELSRFVIMIIIILSLIVMPIQVEKLGRAIRATSLYRQPYKPPKGQSHIILCGCVNQRDKVERFLMEFYHPSKIFIRDLEIHVLLLAPTEPSEDIKDTLASPQFSSLVSYLVGSSLNTDDLKRAGALNALGVFFLCNAADSEEAAGLSDTATVLRVLSVINFNPKATCFAQIIKKKDKEILRNSHVDVILCLDEFRTAIQARNAVCPGISTLIENLFHTFGDLDASTLLDHQKKTININNKSKQANGQAKGAINDNNNNNNNSNNHNNNNNNNAQVLGDGGKHKTWLNEYVTGTRQITLIFILIPCLPLSVILFNIH